jgi:hypothetical protein
VWGASFVWGFVWGCWCGLRLGGSGVKMRWLERLGAVAAWECRGSVHMICDLLERVGGVVVANEGKYLVSFFCVECCFCMGVCMKSFVWAEIV